MELEEQIEYTRNQQVKFKEGTTNWETYRNLQISLENYRALIDEVSDLVNGLKNNDVTKNS